MRGFDIIVWALFVLLFCGCAVDESKYSSVMNSTRLITLQNSPKNSKIFVKFTNTSRFDSNLTTDLSFKFANDGYEVVGDENLASVVIKGNLEYFRRNYIKDPDPFIYPGFGAAHRCRVWGECYDARTNSYIYDAEVSLLIRVDDGVKTKEYRTNLFYKSNININSASTMMDIFNQEIYDEILSYFKDFREI
ncbi:MAG: hypothetical protein GXZ15_03805 [Campylobacter sp.]|nr:hypothetical protein [Campylobacter sp.]